MGGLDGVQPLICRHLVRADYLAAFIIQDSGGGAGEGRRTLGDLKGGKRMEMDGGDGSLNGAADVDVGAPGILRMDSALQADLARSTLPRFARAPHDFGKIEDVGGSA